MSTVVTMAQAQAQLPELVARLEPGDEIIITENQRTVARLIAERPQHSRPAPGLGKGSVLYMSPDFDEPLDEMKEYME